jgi:hypothetical protein
LENRDSIGPGANNLYPGRRRIDAVIDISRAGGSCLGNVQAHAAFQQPNHFVRLKVDPCIRVEVQRAAIGEEDLDASVLRADPVAGEQGHRGGRGFRTSVALENRGTVDDGDMSRSVGRNILGSGWRGCRDVPQQEGSHESQAGHRNLCAQIHPSRTRGEHVE